MWGLGTQGLWVSEHPFKQKLGGGSRHLQPASWDVQPSGWVSGISVSTNKLAAEPRYYHPDPLVQLLGHANEAVVVVEGVKAVSRGSPQR